MKLQLVKAIVILPGTAPVFIPGVILWLSADLDGGMALGRLLTQPSSQGCTQRFARRSLHRPVIAAGEFGD